MEDFFVDLKQSYFTLLDEAGAYPYLTRESLGAAWESGISSPVDFETAEPGITGVTDDLYPEPHFLSPPSCRPVELPLVDPLIGRVQGCWEVPPTEYNIYPTSEIFTVSTDASLNDFILNNDDSSPYEDDATSSADESSQPEFYLEEQEPLIDPEITITTEVDSAGIDLESDQTWWDESWWSYPSYTLSDTKRPTILPYLEHNTWSIPKAWWRGAISLDADSGESMEQPYTVSVALSTELLAPKFDYFSQESNASSQMPDFELSGQELNDGSLIATPVLFVYKVNITENIEFGLLSPLLLTFKTPVPNFTGDEPYSPSAGPVASNNVLSPAEPMAADLLDETQRSSSGDDAMVGLNLLPDLEAILQGLINGSLRG